MQPLAIPQMPLEAPPLRSSSSAAHWVGPELVAEVRYLSWTDDNLLRQVVFEGLREDKPAPEIRSPVPYPKERT
jgi:ATP-dependent DNA ligase